MSLETLDLHRVKHENVEELVSKFFNWSEIPCRVITGNSERMKKIVRKIITSYGYSFYYESDFNHGSLIVVEKSR